MPESTCHMSQPLLIPISILDDVNPTQPEHSHTSSIILEVTTLQPQQLHHSQSLLKVSRPYPTVQPANKLEPPSWRKCTFEYFEVEPGLISKSMMSKSPFETSLTEDGVLLLVLIAEELITRICTLMPVQMAVWFVAEHVAVPTAEGR